MTGMPGILERIREGKVFVADGAMGTMLMERGLKSGQCPEALNLSNPEAVAEVSRLYIGAGAEIIQTNTFGASPLKLSLYGLQDWTEKINHRAVEIAKKIARSHAYVAASCGPSGRLLKPYGDLDPETLRLSCERQVRSLIDAGADAISVETMSDINEALAWVNAVRKISPAFPVFAAMTFDPTPRGFFTMMGVDIEKAAAELTKAGADVLGSNCGNGSDQMVEIAAAFRKLTNKPLLIRPNAGMPILQEGRTVYLETPEYLADNCREMVRIGVNIVGGCCGTTPAHIRAIERKIR
jgi:5-methyltetrahydrofolate--homocysteine methyltransferase